MWARGLTIILEKNLTNVYIESDSSMAVELIKEGDANHAHSKIIIDANALLICSGAKLSHIFKGSNECVDHVVYMGVDGRDAPLHLGVYN